MKYNLLARLLTSLAFLGLILASTTCDDVADALDPFAFHPDSCAEFKFWRNDTLLVKDVKVGVVRDKVDGPSSCRLVHWKFQNEKSWMKYGLDAFNVICNSFDAQLHDANRYWDVTTGTVYGMDPTFADGTWKLHEVINKTDKVIDSGTFEFKFHDTGACP